VSVLLFQKHFFLTITITSYASPALLPVKAKPPSVDRGAKPATPVLTRHSQQTYVLASEVQAPEGLRVVFEDNYC
jgi:hypothetical protein